MKLDLLNFFFLKNLKINIYTNLNSNPNHRYVSLPKNKKYNFNIQDNYLDLTACDFKSHINIYMIYRDYNNNLNILLQNSIFFEKTYFNNFNLNWSLRETFEFFGKKNISLYDTRNLLLDYGFCGNPLLKNFNNTGYKELFFNFFLKKPSYKKVNFITL